MRPPHFPEALKKKEPAELVAYAVLVAGMVFVLMQLLTTCTGYSFYEYRRIEHGISGELIRADGRTLPFRENSFAVPRSGDTLIVRVPLLRENYLPNSSLSFCWPGAIVTASDPEGKLLFSYGGDMEAGGHQIGDVLCIVPLPEDAWGHFVTLTLRQVQGRGTGYFHSLRITRTANAIHYSLVRYLVEFILFVTTFWTALLSTVFFGLAAARRPALRQWFWFSAFCTASSGWVIGYLHFIDAVSRWTYLSANSAYISVCIMPAAISMFLSCWAFPPKIRLFYRRSAALFAVFFAAAVLFELFTPLHYYHYYGAALHAGFPPYHLYGLRSSARLPRSKQRAADHGAQMGTARSLPVSFSGACPLLIGPARRPSGPRHAALPDDQYGSRLCFPDDPLLSSEQRSYAPPPDQREPRKGESEEDRVDRPSFRHSEPAGLRPPTGGAGAERYPGLHAVFF